MRRLSASQPGGVLFVLALGAFVALGPLTIDLYLPAFPSLQRDLETTPAVVQLTLTAAIVGFACGQLVLGPWSDRVGRRGPLITSTTVFIAASLGAALAPDIGWLTLFRGLQGVGAAGGQVIGLAIVRDLFDGRTLVRVLSRLALVSTMAPVVAPVLGSQILAFGDWRTVFFALVAYGVVIVLLVPRLLRPTMLAVRRDAVVRTMRQRYRSLLSDRVFVGAVVIGAMRFSGLLVYLSSSPFLFQEVYGLSPQAFGLLFALNSVGLWAGIQVGARLSRVLSPAWILVVTTGLQICAAVVIVVAGFTEADPIVVLIPLFLFIAAAGCGMPMVQVLALINHRREAATAASVLGASSYGTAAIASPIVGVLGVETAGPMGAVIGVTAAIAALALWLIIRPRSLPPLLD